MTKQEVFTTVKNHLLAQNKKAEEGGICLYRGPNGTKCAIGCLITDEEYEKMVKHRIDRYGIWSLSRHFMIKNLEGINSNFLNRLQGIHDCHEPNKWEERLREFAIAFNLIWGIT